MLGFNKSFIYFICVVSAMGGLLFGYDWVVIGGAKIFYEQYFNYCCPIKSIEYKRISLGHCVFNGRVLFCYSKPFQKIDS